MVTATQIGAKALMYGSAINCGQITHIWSQMRQFIPLLIAQLREEFFDLILTSIFENGFSGARYAI